ncbi:MAG: universal stress protein [Devosia nanyangense]|uniref:Universal stress protein n=1 Tax=Devosia nanyangense TaxID=1228055 RepID=A0A933L491_9HYPH|nr:universal stress protein [Devosia nanyangense]
MTDSDYKRKFLAVVDESPECDRAVSFAAHRVKRVGGTLVLMSVIDTEDFGQFIGVGDVMRAEARNEAERNLDTRIARIAQIGAIRTETVIREGRPAEAIEALIAEDPGIGILVLAAGLGDKGPGPLVTHFAAHNRLHTLVTIVPAAMTEDEIVAVA